MNSRTFAVYSALAVLISAVAAGCGGYTMKSQYRSDVKTVCVPMVTRGTDVYRRNNEIRLTEAVKKQINLATDYQVVNKSTADTELTINIDEIRQQVLSTNPDTGLAREIEFTLVLSFIWKDLRTGEDLKKKSNLHISGTYIPDEDYGLGEDDFVGSEEAINKAAERIVEYMESAW